MGDPSEEQIDSLLRALLIMAPSSGTHGADKMAERVVSLLTQHEWEAGNGQCNVCFGLSPHVAWGDTDRTGHLRSCKLVKAILAYGGKTT